MKIAIHDRPDSFSDRWIAYCQNKNIPFKKVNCYDSDIIEQLKDCDALMWHHHQSNYKDKLFAKRLLFSLEQSGVKVFPNFNTGWHFDDKVGQKYLLEAVRVPLVPSYVFYEKQKALEWANHSTFPKVWKLRGGAGSSNVSLMESKSEAVKKINKAFGKGFSQYNRWSDLKERWRKYRVGQNGFFGVIKGIGRLFIPTQFAKMHGREKGYVYFQDFIPNNEFDIRVIVIGNRAFALKRLVRENDFRASGSGNIIYNKDEIPENCVLSAFQLNQKLKSQSLALDFVFDAYKSPLIVELSYGFSVEAYDFCPGYWDSSLNWHEGQFNPQEWMVEDLVNSL